MSRKANFWRFLERVASEPVPSRWANEMLDLMESVLTALLAGDDERAEQLLDDAMARALLRSALGDDWQL